MAPFWTQYGPNLGVLLALFVFGCCYATLIAWLNTYSFLEGYTALAVVLGVAITLSSAQYMHHPEPLHDFLWELLAFGASGAPMIFNNLREHFNRLKDERQAVQELGHGQTESIQ